MKSNAELTVKRSIFVLGRDDKGDVGYEVCTSYTVPRQIPVHIHQPDLHERRGKAVVAKSGEVCISNLIMGKMNITAGYTPTNLQHLNIYPNTTSLTPIIISFSERLVCRIQSKIHKVHHSPSRSQVQP